MLKTNSKEVKDKIKAFIFKEATPGADDNGENVPDYLRRIYTAAAEILKDCQEEIYFCYKYETQLNYFLDFVDSFDGYQVEENKLYKTVCYCYT